MRHKKTEEKIYNMEVIMSSYLNLKNAIEKFESDSNQNELSKIDEAFQKIVVGNQSDLIKSLDLVEDFLLKTLNDSSFSRSLKKSA